MNPVDVLTLTLLLSAAHLLLVDTTSVTRTIECKGLGASLTSYECSQQHNITAACYYDGYHQSRKSCGSICNGALFVGTRGRRCRDYCRDYLQSYCHVGEPKNGNQKTSTTADQLKNKQTTQYHIQTPSFPTTHRHHSHGHRFYGKADVQIDAPLIGLVCLVVVLVSLGLICHFKERGTKSCCGSKHWKQIDDELV